nr:pectin esterase [Lachnospira sp.]
MGKKTKKRLSCFLCAMLLFVTGIETSAFTGVFAATARKIDVWDFGAVQESDTQLYNNHISAQDWEQCENVSSAGKFAEGTTVFGDLTLTHTVNDRLFSTSSKNYGTNALAKTAYADGYTAGGMYYCNGTGGEGRRNITIANVEAGDKIVVYMASSNAVTGELVFTYLGEGGTQKDTESFTNVGTKYEFIAQYSGSYKIYTTAAAGKPIYNRVMRIPAVTVSGTIELNGEDISGCQLLFMNKRTNTATQAKLNGNSYSVSLAAGEEYTAVLSGVTGIGFTNDTKVVTTDISEVLTGKENVSLKVETKSVYTYTGRISGFTEGYDISKLKVTMEPAEGAMADAVELKIAEDFSFTAVLEPDVEYTASLQGVNDYEIISGKTVNDNQNHTEDIIVAAKAVYAVNGEFTGLEAGTNVTELTFTNVDDNYVYAGTVTNDGYEISLRNGAYAVSAAADGYRTTTHVVVNGAAVKKDILFVSTAAAEPMTRVPDLYVGYEDKAEYNYNTVKEAVAAAAAMNPSSEEERITIHIAPGTYREQVIITTPYLSLVNDSDKEVLMTWYYGIGYEYYSADGTGYYNVENAYDQYAKSTASKWGCAVYVKNTATGFSADGIVFENSFNRYLTDEEIEDGVTPAADTGLPQRKYGTDVASKAATERATAMAVEADKVEFTNCAFLGSQDTLYTGNSATSLYFKNCR